MSQNILNERRECRTNLVGTHVAIRAEGKKVREKDPILKKTCILLNQHASLKNSFYTGTSKFSAQTFFFLLCRSLASSLYLVCSRFGKCLRKGAGKKENRKGGRTSLPDV